MADWYYKIAEQVVGPLSAEQLRALAGGGRLAPNDPVAKSKEGPWVPASRVKGLFEVASIDDEPDETTASSEPRTEPTPPKTESKDSDVSVVRPPEEPPMPQPPVVMPPQTGVHNPAAQPTREASTGVAPSDVGSRSAGGFAIQTDEVAATDRFRKRKRVKKPREPLTKKQRNKRLVAWLAIATVGGIVVFASIPFLRKLTRSAPEAVATKNPIASDVDLAPAGDGLEGVFSESSRAGRSRPSAALRRSGEATTHGSGDTTEDLIAPRAPADVVDVKLVRAVLDRPSMSSADGRTARTTNRFLLIELELRTKSPDAPVQFQGWLRHTKEVSLTDDHGIKYEVRTPMNFEGMSVDGQSLEPVFLSADGPKTDVLVFAWPEDEAPGLPSNSEETLNLRLPRAAYGEKGELRIPIPLSQIEVIAGPIKKAGESHPAAKPGTSDNVEEDNGGPIPIPGVTE